MPSPPSLTSLYAARAGALPARFRRARLLIIGCGDVGQRLLQQRGAPAPPLRVLVLTSSPERLPLLRAMGVTPILGNLDQPATLARLGGLAQRVLHLAPPTADPPDGRQDRRSAALLAALSRRTPPQALVYGSTSGVYGDWGGACIDETATPRAATPRALRRLDAERRMRHLGAALAGQLRTTILRIPGIYAPDRPGGTPRERLLRGTPVLRPEDDVFTNHIHADDLARACWLALWRGRPQRVLNVCDDTRLTMGDWFDAAADALGLPRPQRVTRAQARQLLSPMQWSFMGESRQLDNRRLKAELRMRLRWPDAVLGLQSKR